jgi:hypothetical protein
MGVDMKGLKRNKKSGFASLEAVSLLFIFVVLLTYCFGTFGIVHTGILNSISARTYAFETFRNRADLTYFRDQVGSQTPESTIAYGMRAHGVIAEGHTGGARFVATERRLAFGADTDTVGRDSGTHRGLTSIDRKREKREVNPVWIKTVYGICLNYLCQGVAQP